jgi:hypothetical protein
MFSITLKRSVVTLGVVAGLLATAGAAGADTTHVRASAQTDPQRVLELPEEADAQSILNTPRTPRP